MSADLLQPQMRELSQLPAPAQGQRRGGIPAGPADFRGARRHAVRAGEGGDPRPGPVPRPGQAHGLCFSVQPGVPAPPSLENIFKEIESDLGIPRPDHGCLMPWAQRGVLLLNAVLTVEEGKAGAHQGKGWEGFTDHVVDVLNRDREALVFLLWGSYAQAKGKVIDTRAIAC
jgi:uracil-DNA glycosylase